MKALYLMRAILMLSIVVGSEAAGRYIERGDWGTFVYPAIVVPLQIALLFAFMRCPKNSGGEKR